MDRPRRLLLTGSTGFIGRAVAPILTAAGWQVVPGRRDHLAEDVAGCSAVVHLAGRAHVMRERAADPASLYRADNVDLTLTLARAAASAGVSRFVFMSTAKVFGEGRDEPYVETDLPAPEDDYARSKLAAEESLFAIARETGMEAVVLRPPLVYGPGVRANFLSLIRAIDRGWPLPLGAVRNQRSLVSTANLGSAIVAALTHPAAAGRVFAVTDGEDVSTPDLILRIGAALGRTPRLIPVPTGLLAIAATVARSRAALSRVVGTFVLDTTPLRAQLGWRPDATLDEGLRETARRYKDDRIAGG